MFEFVKKLFKKNREEEPEISESPERRVPLSRRNINMRDEDQRERFIKECCEQMKEAERECDRLTEEYAYVTGYLTDMEEIEALPPEERKKINAVADKLTGSSRQKAQFDNRPSAMSDADFARMERFSDGVEEAIDQLFDAEDYRKKIKRDLRRLNQEHHSFEYRKKSLVHTKNNLRGMLVICIVAFVACMLLLLLLQTWLGMKVQFGYMAAVIVMVFSIYIIYMKFMDASGELKKVEKSINKLILLQNTVKIRYVNNTNLLDYLCIKYQVNSSDELQELWDKYQEEKEAREKMRRLHLELDGTQKELVSILSSYRIKDPHVWIKQPEALIIKGEMVEIRHGLIAQRQQLRKQMEYNQSIAGEAREELIALTQEFPRSKPQILKMIEKYEK